jgi:hypothetical protein
MDSLPRVFGDPQRLAIGERDPRLENESTGDIAAYTLGFLQELAARVRDYCEDPLQTEDARREACQLLINVTREGAAAIHFLSRQFLSPFREVAQKATLLPCLFPAHPDDIKALKNFMLEDLGLGKLHPLKLRSARKTFSKRTDINALLLHYIRRIHEEAAVLLSRRINDPFGFASSPKEEVERLADEVPLSAKTAPQWLELIWKLLLVDCPKPEENDLLSPLGSRRSRTDRAPFVKGKARKPRGYVRSSIKEALGKYLVRMLRDQKQSESDK